LVLSFSVNGLCTTYFVDHTSSGGDGSEWSRAYPTLQDALDVAKSGDEIWVAEGTYIPQKDIAGSSSPADLRTRTFYISKDIKIYGGFKGDEMSRSEREPEMNICILSGDLGSPQDTIDNSYHVVYFKGVSRDCILNGFTIEQGNAAGAGEASRGAGIYIDADATTTSPTISRCVISDNFAHINGGGASVYAKNGIAAPLFYRVMFKENYASLAGAVECRSDGAGAINNSSFVNCIFYGNHVSASGGALTSTTNNGGLSKKEILHCTFTKNVAGVFGGAMRMIKNPGGEPDSTIIKNCIFFDNAELPSSVDIDKGSEVYMEIDYCSTEGSDCGDLVSQSGFVCGSNMQYNVDPLFMDPFCCNAEISSTSGAIDKGLYLNFEETEIAVDYYGNTRPVIGEGDPDIGAYEFDPNLDDPYLLAHNESLELFECPVGDKYELAGALSQFVLYLDDVNGNNLETINACGRFVFDLSSYNSGTYFIRAVHNINSELDIQLMVEVD